MSFKRWKVKTADEAAVQALCGSLHISSLAARVLAARGYATPELARQFFDDGGELEDPMHIADMEKAAARINAAIEKEERIAVFGDYDVDGITSTSMMYLYLQSRGADVVLSLPAREATGYGLSAQAVENLTKVGASLIVTVDNGISAYEEIALAQQKGVDVIVCDHHLPGETLPEAFAVVDPLRAEDASSFKDLAGVGVAFKLLCAVEGCAPGELLEEYGYLVAIGTVADIMPLRGENRTIVRRGLASLAHCDNMGLAALCEVAGLDLETVDSQSVAFTLSPRINAAGRMGNAELALRLLITDDMEEAAELAQQLEALNKERQAAETDCAKAIARAIDADAALVKKPVLIVAGEALHGGVIGIACSRLVERYGKPVIVITNEGNHAKGSGRSVRGFSLHDAINACADLLQKWGGHELAAGFTLSPENVEPFRERIYEYCRNHPFRFGCAELVIDSEPDLAEISEAAVGELAALAPFGRGNEEPVFALRGATLAAAAPLGEKHTRLTFKKNGRTLAGALFGVAPARLPFRVGDRLDAAFTLSIFHANGRNYISVKFKDVAPPGLTEDTYRSIEAYACLCAGRALAPEDRALLSLRREDVAAVYRRLRAAPFDRQDMRALIAAAPSLTPGKTCAILDVLAELGLAETAPDGEGRQLVRAAAVHEKRPLEGSALFCALAGPAQPQEVCPA